MKVAPMALCIACLLLLILFLPISDSWIDNDPYENKPTRVGSLFGDKGDTSHNSFYEDSDENPNITGETPPAGGGSTVPGEDPLDKIPATTKYHAGISEDAQKINDEFFKLCQYYATKTNVPNQKALAMYCLAGSITEQGGKCAEPAQIFPTCPWTVAEYKANPDCIKLAGQEKGKMGASMWWQEDIDTSHAISLGPLSVTPLHFTNQYYPKYVPVYEEMGTSMKTVSPPRKPPTNPNNPGDQWNWYDSVQMTCGVMGYNFDRGKKALAGFNTENPYAFIGICSMMNNIGESIITSNQDKMLTLATFSGGSKVESGTPRFIFEFTALCSEKWVIDEIRAYVLQAKPYSYAFSTANKDLYVPLQQKLRAEAIKRDPNFFDDSRYNCSTKENYLKWGDAATGNMYSSWETSKSTTALRTIICAVILEERYNGAY